jgi:hypothetical protein
MHNMDNTYLEKKNLWLETILKAHIQMQVSISVSHVFTC